MNLKELTWDHHQNAERQDFVKELFGGISEERYAVFLYNLHKTYDILEMLAMSQGLFGTVGHQFRRAPKIWADFQELWKKDEQPEYLPVVEEYGKYLMSIQMDKEKLMAHVYVRHMGDLSGGQMIAKKAPGSCTMFDFTNDAGLTNDQLKDLIREQCDDSMAEEAKLAFDYATRMFQEMSKTK